MGVHLEPKLGFGVLQGFGVLGFRYRAEDQDLAEDLKPSLFYQDPTWLSP